MSLLQELQRRNVIRVATAYIVVAWLIIQVVETIFPAFGFSDKAVRIVVIVFSIGFVPALIAAWAFELTSDGLKLDKDVDHPSSSSPKQRHTLDRLIIVILVLGVTYFALDKFVLAPERAEDRESAVAEQAKAEAIVGYYGNRSIAVLPFVNMSSDSEQEYFAEGISEEILNLLAHIRELRVISRSSAFAMKGMNLEIPKIAERLGVAHILEGSVRKSGNTVRVTAQLIEAHTDTHLWSQTYDRELDNLFAIQDEIAADVASNLQIKLLKPLPQSRVVDPEVYALTRQASQIQEVRPEGVGGKMKLLLDRALAVDPDYVPALELTTYADFFLEYEGVIDSQESEERYEVVKRKILDLEPDNGFIDSSDAWQAAYKENDPEKAAKLFASAMRKDPADPNVMRLAGIFARHLGRMDDSIRILQHVAAIDPLCFLCLYQLSRSYLYSEQYEKAENARTRYLATGGSGGHLHYSLIKVLQGDPEFGLRILEPLPNDHLQIDTSRAIALFSLGNRVAAQEHLDHLLASDDPDAVAHAIELSAWMGQNDLAFELSASPEAASIWFGSGKIFNPVYQKLRADPRWDEFRKSIGMSRERLDAIEFEFQLPD
jgi:adenylate cyclase